jgi:hypothetical protein
MPRALWGLLLCSVPAVATEQPAGAATGEDVHSCGSTLGRQRAQELKMGEHLLALVQAAAHNLQCQDDLPSGVETACPAAVLSHKPLVVSVPMTTAGHQPSGGTLLKELLEAQPSGLEHEDGWHMSPKGVTSTAVAAVLADAVRSCTYASRCICRSSTSVRLSAELCTRVARSGRHSTHHISSHCRPSALLARTHPSTTTTSYQQIFLPPG